MILFDLAEDRRKYNGGNKNAGRKPKSQEIKLAEKIRNVIDDESLISELAVIAMDRKNRNQMRAIELLTGYMYGKPTQRVENVELQELPEIHFVRAKTKKKS